VELNSILLKAFKKYEMSPFGLEVYMNLKAPLIIFSMIAVFMLAGCGGGNSDGISVANPSNPTTSPNPNYPVIPTIPVYEYPHNSQLIDCGE
jgi:hypothetical protein